MKNMNGFTDKADVSKSLTPSAKKSSIELQPKVPMAAKVFDAPAYSLPSMVEIAPRYIRACMILKRKNE